MREELEIAANIIGKSSKVVFAWAMGAIQHDNGYAEIGVVHDNLLASVCCIIHTRSPISIPAMHSVPKTLEEAIIQAKEAASAAFNDGYKRVQAELVFPEIALQAQALALDFSSIFSEYGSGLRILFADTGAAALARRDWQEVPFKISDLGTSRTPVEMKISDDDRAFLVVCPSSVEIAQVEKLCNIADDRPVLLLIPQLEDVAVVGIGYAARQLRERFINTLYSVYFLRPVEGGLVFKSHPSAWQVWLELEEDYKFVVEQEQKPIGEELERILIRASNSEENKDGDGAPKPKKAGILQTMQSFLRALSS